MNSFLCIFFIYIFKYWKLAYKIAIQWIKIKKIVYEIQISLFKGKKKIKSEDIKYRVVFVYIWTEKEISIYLVILKFYYFKQYKLNLADWRHLFLVISTKMASNGDFESYSLLQIPSKYVFFSFNIYLNAKLNYLGLLETRCIMSGKCNEAERL